MKTPRHSEGMMILLAGAGIGLLFYLITHVLTRAIPDGNREIAIHTLGIVEGVVVTIYSYYFGSSAGSRAKDQKEEPKP
jgi:hypothetical protein